MKKKRVCHILFFSYYDCTLNLFISPSFSFLRLTSLLVVFLETVLFKLLSWSSEIILNGKNSFCFGAGRRVAAQGCWHCQPPRPLSSRIGPIPRMNSRMRGLSLRSALQMWNVLLFMWLGIEKINFRSQMD